MVSCPWGPSWDHLCNPGGHLECWLYSGGALHQEIMIDVNALSMLTKMKITAIFLIRKNEKMMLIILVPRKPLFPGQYEVDQLGKIFEVGFTFPLIGCSCWEVTGWPICFALSILKSKNQVIGTPLEADWPEESSVLRSNFSYARGRGVHGILAELDPQVGCHVITLDLTNARSHEMREKCQNPR